MKIEFKNNVNRIICYILTLTILLSSLGTGLVLFVNALTDTLNGSKDVWDGTTYTKPSKGAGTETEPYLISTPEELAYLNAVYVGPYTYYKLTADIYLNDITKINWQDGTVEDGYTANQWYKNATPNWFNGVIDGDGHTVYGMYVTDETNDIHLGLIQGTKNNSDKKAIKNLGVDYAYINAPKGDAAAFIGLTQSGTATFDTCYVGANVTLKGANAGSFCGRAGTSLMISKSYSLANVTGTARYGAVVGDCWGSTRTIDNSFFINAPITSHTGHGFTCTSVYATDVTGATEGATKLATNNMQGLDALTNASKMPTLSECGAFTATEDYPYLNKFPYSKQETNPDTLWDGVSYKKPVNGAGTESDPYLISTPEELAYLNAVYVGPYTYYKLTADIYLNDITKINWQDGTVEDGYTVNQWYKNATPNWFNGVIDGDGHTVYGMYVTDETNDIHLGLIQGTKNNSDIKAIKNLGVDYAYVNAPKGDAAAFIGLTQSGTATFDTCYVGTNVTLKGANAGSFCGRAGSAIVISKSYSLANVTGTARYGAAVGDCWNGTRTIENSFFTNAPITSHTGHGFTCTNVYATDITGAIEGATKLTANNMKGQDALTNSTKMRLLAECGAFEPTSSYPALRIFGKHTVPDSANQWDGTVAEPQGEGTENNPILVTNPQELAYIIKNGGNDKYYKLSADIYLNDKNKTNYLTGESEKNYIPQQWYTDADVTPFKGTIDGDGHVIYGLYTSSNTTDASCGLIPSIAANSTVTIKNLGIDFAYFKASNGFVSAFIAKNKNAGTVKIENCYAGSDVSLIGKVVGVFYGYGAVSYKISKAYSLATLSASGNYGVVGESWNSATHEINNLYASKSPITTKYEGRPTVENVYYSADAGVVGKKIADDNMKGLDVLSEPTKMPLLEDCEAFEPTDSYPILKVFSTPSGEEEEVPEGKIWSGKVAKKFASGTGTENDPYIITNGAELAYALKGKGFNGSYFKLTNDIYLNDVKNIDWAKNTENNEWIVNSEFNGHLDGDGYIVYGVWFPEDIEAESTGLISKFNSGTIKNIGVRYSQIRATVNAGAIVGITSRGGLKIIDKCFSDETVTVSYTTTQNGGASGIIGQAGYEQAKDLTLKISNCYSKAKLSGHSDQRVNGIIGTAWVSYYTMENCYSITYSPYFANNGRTCSNMLDKGMELNEIYKNIYTDSRIPGEWEKFTLIPDNENMTGESAKKYMSGLDYVNVFETVVKSTPKLRIFRTYTGEEVDISGDSEVYESGSGKKSDPYIIANAEQLRYLLQSENTKGKYYEISHDIYLNDVSRSNWTLSNPKLWYSDSNSQTFEGCIDGKGHYIYGLYMNEEPAPYNNDRAWETSVTALFPTVSTTTVIRNIHIRKSYISGKGKVASIVGEIRNVNNGLYTQVMACSADDTVVLKGQIVGGIALGWAGRGLKLYYSYFTGDLSATDKERGNALVADIWGSDWEVIQCYFLDYPAHRPSMRPSGIGGVYGSYSMSNVKYLTVEQMTGLNAKENMVDFEWDTVWKTVENDTPHLNVVPGDKIVKLYDEGVKGRVWSGYRAKDYASGSGTEKDPYIIETPEQMLKLVAFDTDTKGKYYKLVADLKLNDTSKSNWEKSAREWVAGQNVFYGHFDGNGYVVSGLYFDTSFTDVGLFQRVSSGAVIEKLGVTKSTIKSLGDEKKGSFAGAIAAIISWEISDEDFVPPIFSQCFADHTVYIEAYSAGGLIGGVSRWINVDNCYFTGKLSGINLVGQCTANIWNTIPSSVSNSYFASADGSPLTNHIGAQHVKIENVYHRGSNYEVIGCESIATMLIRGDKAKEYMPNLDYEKIWKTVKGGTPVLRCFKNAEKYSDTTMPEKVEISFATQGGSKCEPIYGYPSYTNLLVDELPVPTKYGYEFEGWHYFSGGYVPVEDSIFPEYSIVLHAKWKAISIIVDFEEDIDPKYDLNAAAEQFKPGVKGYTTEYVNGGYKSMHVIEQNEIDPLFLLSYKNKLDVGSEYEMTIRMSTDSVKAIDGTIELLHANHPQIDSDIVGQEKVCEFSDVTRGKWMEYKVTFTANSPYLLMKTSKGNSLFFDDIQIVPTGEKGELLKSDVIADDSSSSNSILFILLGIASVLVLAAISTTVIFVIRKKKQ